MDQKYFKSIKEDEADFDYAHHPASPLSVMIDKRRESNLGPYVGEAGRKGITQSEKQIFGLLEDYFRKNGIGIGDFALTVRVHDEHRLEESAESKEFFGRGDRTVTFSSVGSGKQLDYMMDSVDHTFLMGDEGIGPVSMYATTEYKEDSEDDSEDDTEEIVGEYFDYSNYTPFHWRYFYYPEGRPGGPLYPEVGYKIDGSIHKGEEWVAGYDWTDRSIEPIGRISSENEINEKQLNIFLGYLQAGEDDWFEPQGSERLRLHFSPKSEVYERDEEKEEGEE